MLLQQPSHQSHPGLVVVEAPHHADPVPPWRQRGGPALIVVERDAACAAGRNKTGEPHRGRSIPPVEILQELLVVHVVNGLSGPCH
jgi:hypothetical protein